MIIFGDQETECVICYRPLSGRQEQYCSARCKMRAHRKKSQQHTEKACVLCGAMFRPTRGNQTYCDFYYADETCAALQNELAARKLELDDARWEKTCEHCGEHAGWNGRGRPRRFCSNRCKTAFYRAAKQRKTASS